MTIQNNSRHFTETHNTWWQLMTFYDNGGVVIIVIDHLDTFELKKTLGKKNISSADNMPFSKILKSDHITCPFFVSLFNLAP